MAKPRRFSRFIGGLRIGADYFDRRGVVVAGAPRGVVDRVSDLAHPGIDVATIDPAVATFFEDTAGLLLDIHSRWRFPFSLAWRLLRPLIRVFGQFVLPRSYGRIATRVVALDAAADGRSAAIVPRAVIRTYVDGEGGAGDVFQAVAYSTWERNGVRYMSAAFPQPPFGQVAGFLRLDALGEGAVVLTSTKRDGDDAGVWFVVGPIALPSPFQERFSLWAPSMSNVPRDLDTQRVPGTTIVGRHEQRIFGVRFVTHDYWFRPATS